jgi:hypothetical protein
VVDAEYTVHRDLPIDVEALIREVVGRRRRIEHNPFQLPEPEPQLRVPQFNILEFERVPVSRGSPNRDDRVIVVDLTKPKARK